MATDPAGIWAVLAIAGLRQILPRPHPGWQSYREWRQLPAMNHPRRKHRADWCPRSIQSLSCRKRLLGTSIRLIHPLIDRWSTDRQLCDGITGGYWFAGDCVPSNYEGWNPNSENDRF